METRARRLEAQASDFAEKLTRLLNTTVCDSARVGVVLRPDQLAFIGTSPNRQTYTAQPHRLRARSGVHCWLTISARLYLDEDKYLTVERSAWIVHGGEEAQDVLFHYDYERGKDRYAEAHIQVNATSSAMERLLAAAGRGRDPMGKLHFPVGGRRFRPAIEDVLEFLIDERLVDPKPYARDELNRSRDEFRTMQLRAAIRRNPDVAVAALASMNYQVQPPEEQGRILQFIRRKPKGRR